MKTTLLFLLLVTINQTSAQTKAFLTVSPAFSQFFEYQNVILSCQSPPSGVWTVWRYTSGSNSVLSQCGTGWGQPMSSSCHVNTIKLSDSGVYWCESECKESSNTVNITVTGGAVILQGPVLPVTQGDNVTLHCKTKNSSKFPAEFFKDNSSIGSDRAHLMTIHNVSKSDEGAYGCKVGSNRSSTSWLLIKDDSDPAFLTVSPDSSQMKEYRDFELSCGEDSASRGWRVLRATTSTVQELSSCCDKEKRWGSTTKSGCMLSTAKKTDSATYWCESLTKQRSNSVTITVHGGGQVILQCPVLPVNKGDNVTLHCLNGPSKQPAEFYKVGDNPGRSAPEGNITIYHVSSSDQGQYKCQFRVKGGAPVESLPCRLCVRDPSGTASSSEASTVLTVLRHVVVACPYLICTGIRVSMFRLKKTGRRPPLSLPMSPSSTDYEAPDPPYDDVIPDVTTEHHF